MSGVATFPERAVVSLVVPRPHEVTSPYELCDAIEAALPMVTDAAELAEAKAKLLAIETYMAQHTKQGRARLAAALRRIEIRMGEVLGEATRDHDRSPGAKSLTGNLGAIPKKERHELRLLAAHRDVAEGVIAKADDAKPPSRKKCLDAIRDHLATNKEANVSKDNTAAIADLSKLGLTTQAIADELGLSTAYVSRVATSGGISLISDNNRTNTVERHRRVAVATEMAASGNTSRQIAETVGMTIESFRNFAKRNNITIPADAVLGKSGHIDTTRVIEQTVLDLEGAVMSLDLIPLDMSVLNPTQIDNWVTSLEQSLRALTRFKNQLKEMTQ